MNSYEAEVQAILRDVDDSHVEGLEPRHLPYSRHVNPTRSTSGFFETPRPASAQPYQHQQSMNRQFLESQPQYFRHQAPKPSSAYRYHDQRDDVLDGYARALLAEPQPPLQLTGNGRNGTIAPGRLSLPGHTAPYTPTPTAELTSIHPRRGRNAVSSSQNFKAKISQYVHTPPNQVATSSSPLRKLPSSPLADARERRPTQQRQVQPSSIGRLPQSAASQSTWPNTKRTRTNPSIEVDSCARARERPIPLLDSSSSPYPRQINLGHAPPIVQGTQLVSTNDLPDRFRSIFPFNPFNAIQSKCYPTAYQTNVNLVVSAPTGGGKTAVFEMAICHLVSGFENDQYKIVYMAPTKSLCSERQRDWQAKFAALDLVCAELTGDTDYAHLRSVQSANIVITTPEKWDSMTRQWKDHAKLMQLVKLFLIDEVHMLRDNRGATLEAVVSRMKSVGSNVRFVALSATVPNSEDVATWLGQDHTNQHLPAAREVFGEEFRPVRLQKHIIGFSYRGNDYGFEGICDPKLPEIIAKYGHKKPVMIFCITRKAAASTAKLLANSWASKTARDRQWPAPTQRIIVSDPDLTNALHSAVAFHHAGLDGNDRRAVENGFLTGQISVICCTSTLAVGVNLPCHLVIIKNTVGYQGEGLKEYADLEIMQMLGRAGRPQFDYNAVAVILTKQEKVKKYEQLVTGGELLESCLHLNLIDHLNAEIGLGTVYDLHTAKRWLAGTFLYVRLRQNPGHYKLDEDGASRNLDERIETICQRDLELLEGADLVRTAEKIKATELGNIMARYYVKFKTMETFLSLGPRSKIYDIVSSIVQAEEFHEIRFRSAEKKFLKEINNSNGIKFPIQVDIAMHAHKRSLLLQSELGGVDFPVDEQYTKYRRQYQKDKHMIFSQIHRLIRCVVDIQIYLQDAVGTLNALELARSFSAGVWDNSPFQMKQISQIGPVAIRKFAMGGINSIEALETAEPHRIELLLSKNPPFGTKLLANLKGFPKLRVSIKMMDKNSKKGRPVSIKLKLECEFMNEKVPAFFNRRLVYVCLLTERSDGHLVDFRRISGKKLNNGQEILISADMTSHTQYITCYVMCDEIAGTMRYAELKPELPAYLFPPAPLRYQHEQEQTKCHAGSKTLVNDEFGADDIDDQDMVDAAKGQEFENIENFGPTEKSEISKKGSQKDISKHQIAWKPEKLENGKWACNHNCKDKKSCKHLCCREGLDKPPKAPKTSFVPVSTTVDPSSLPPKGSKAQSKLELVIKKTAKGPKGKIEEIDLADEEDSPRVAKKIPHHIQKFQKLHQDVAKGLSTPIIPQNKASYNFSRGGQPQLSFLKDDKGTSSGQKMSIDYDDDWLEDLPSPSKILEHRGKETAQDGPVSCSTDTLVEGKDLAKKDSRDINSPEDFDLSQFDDDQSDMEAAMFGLSDSIYMQDDQQSPNKHASIEVAGYLNAEPIKTSGSDALLPTISELNDKVSECEKLFISTDSPEKMLPTMAEKRSAEEDLEDENFLKNTSMQKRQKHNNEADMVLEPAVSAGIQILAPASAMKPGQPAWVYEFDPAFIAEYQDIVDFI